MIFRADINLLAVKKRKKTVLKISTGHKPLPYKNNKNSKIQKTFQKLDA